MAFFCTFSILSLLAAVMLFKISLHYVRCAWIKGTV